MSFGETGQTEKTGLVPKIDYNDYNVYIDYNDYNDDSDYNDYRNIPDICHFFYMSKIFGK